VRTFALGARTISSGSPDAAGSSTLAGSKPSAPAETNAPRHESDALEAERPQLVRRGLRERQEEVHGSSADVACLHDRTGQRHRDVRAGDWLSVALHDAAVAHEARRDHEHGLVERELAVEVRRDDARVALVRDVEA
jgi:hypothetical protein